MPNDKVRHGNYPKYYEFRKNDSRPEMLRELVAKHCDVFTTQSQGLHVLDLGCNTGQFTASVKRNFEEILQCKVNMLGVDIDSALCEIAERTYSDMKFICANISEIVENNSDDKISEHMRASNIESFDVICCFSVFMYIHLNYGDEGLQKVLDYLCSRANYLILELQSWRKYRDQRRRMTRDAGGATYEMYDTLKWRDSGLEMAIVGYTELHNFKLVEHDSKENEFKRKLYILKKEI